MRYMIGEKKTLLNILHSKANWVVHILRRNCLLCGVIEGRMPEVKGIGKRRTQLFDDLRNRRRFWELKEEAEKGGNDCISQPQARNTVFGAANKQYT